VADTDRLATISLRVGTATIDVTEEIEATEATVEIEATAVEVADDPARPTTATGRVARMATSMPTLRVEATGTASVRTDTLLAVIAGSENGIATVAQAEVGAKRTTEVDAEIGRIAT
jgi:hypothetical protein